MKIIVKERGSGKTTEIIQECAEKGGYIVCHNNVAAQYVWKRAQEIKVSIPFPLTFREFVKKEYYGPGIKQVYIDDLDSCIKMLSKVPIKTITMRKSEEG